MPQTAPTVAGQWMLLVNGEPASIVAFTENGRIDNYNTYKGEIGFHVYGAADDADAVLEGLYIFEGETGRNVVCAPGAESPRIQYHDKTGDETGYILYRPDGTCAGTAPPSSSGLPKAFYAFEDAERTRPVFKAAPWQCATWSFSPHDATLIIVEADTSTKVLKVVSNDAMVQILDSPWYRRVGVQSPSVTLMKHYVYFRDTLASKYDCLAFKDKLCFAEAKVYAARSFERMMEDAGLQEVSVLDFGAGVVDDGPFPEAVRKGLRVSTWIAVDISKKNSQLNVLAARAQPDLRVYNGDMLAESYPKGAVDVVLAKDSMNNMDDDMRARYMYRMRQLPATFFFANCRPGSGGCPASFTTGAESIYTYRNFDPAACGLKLLKTYPAPERETHPAVWSLYSF